MAQKKKSLKLSVKLHLEIYSEAGIRQAAEACAGLADFAFARRGAYLEASITAKGGALSPELPGEFLNRALVNSI